MNQTVGGQRGFNRYRKQTVNQKTNKNEDNMIIIEQFYLLKTAQSLIDHAVEEMYNKYYGDLFEGKDQMIGRFGGRNEGNINHKADKYAQKQLFDGVKILKFKNQEAYVYGDTQLIYFSDIRECIKNNQSIELILMNVDQDTVVKEPMQRTYSAIRDYKEDDHQDTNRLNYFVNTLLANSKLAI
jgi:hypothetical protein